MNKNPLWSCDIYHNTINISSKSKHSNSKTHKYKEKNGIIVKEHEFTKPDIDGIDYIPDKIFKDSRDKFVLTFE